MEEIFIFARVRIKNIPINIKEGVNQEKSEKIKECISVIYLYFIRCIREKTIQKDKNRGFNKQNPELNQL
jgi:hypothetical protein